MSWWQGEWYCRCGNQGALKCDNGQCKVCCHGCTFHAGKPLGGKGGKGGKSAGAKSAFCSCGSLRARRCENWLCGRCCTGCAFHSIAVGQNEDGMLCACGNQAAVKCDNGLCKSCCDGCSIHDSGARSTLSNNPAGKGAGKQSSGVIKCGRPSHSKKKAHERELEGFTLPEEYRKGKKLSDVAEKRLLIQRVISQLGEVVVLSELNAKPLLHELLWLEEAQMKRDIRTYDQFLTEPLRHTGYAPYGGLMYSLYVPGLAEKRPSVLKGDFIWITQTATRNRAHERTFQASAENIRDESVELHLPSSFDNRPPFHVRFSFNRTPLRHMHRAIDERTVDVFGKGESFEMLMLRGRVDRAYHRSHIGGLLSSLVDAASDRVLRLKSSGLNFEQVLFVEAVLIPVAKPVPVLCWGPPGCGKSHVICTAVLELLKAEPGARCLICCPSNTAVDVLCKRLANQGVPVTDMLRLNSRARIKADVDSDVLPFCPTRQPSQLPDGYHIGDKVVLQADDLSGLARGTLVMAGAVGTVKGAAVDEPRSKVRCDFPESGHYGVDVLASLLALSEAGDASDEWWMPSASEFCAYRIILCTCTFSASVLSCFKRGAQELQSLFTHCFIDEAGQAMEPEAWIPLGLMNPRTKCFFVGDHKQLGSVVRNAYAIKMGLERSVQERMWDLLSGHINSNSTRCFALVKSYRAHPSILKLFNGPIYGGVLQCHTDLAQVRQFEDMNSAVGRKDPIIFHHVCGTERKEEGSPSWLNTEELNYVKHYIHKLVRERGTPLETIGIISPYRKQCAMLRKWLQTQGFASIVVGTVETFQGSERDVIIISTVRSQKKEELKRDLKFSIGFLGSFRRTNVAISRAKALLVVIGNLELLSQDNTWSSVLKIAASMQAIRMGDPASAQGSRPLGPEEVRALLPSVSARSATYSVNVTDSGVYQVATVYTDCITVVDDGVRTAQGSYGRGLGTGAEDRIFGDGEDPDDLNTETPWRDFDTV